VQGLVMPLIDPDFKVLAGPPSLQSCSRDVYAQGFTLAWSQVSPSHAISPRQRPTCTRRASCMATCMVTTSCIGRAKPCWDFGAAWFYDAGQPHAWGVQAMEVRPTAVCWKSCWRMASRKMNRQEAASSPGRGAPGLPERRCAARPHFEAIVAMLDNLAAG
jgi:hypothetical protein